MILRTCLAASLLLTAQAALATPAKACDAKCRIETVLTHNVGIALDKITTLEQLKKFGAVKADRMTLHPNPYYPGKNDTVHDIAFDGIFVRATITPDRRLLIDRIRLSNPNRPLPFGIRFGQLQDPNDFRKILGPPDQTKLNTVPNGSEWVYSNTEGTATLTFVVQSGALKAVTWDYTPGD